jgi:hypothetical protein
MTDTHARLARCFATVFPSLAHGEIEGASTLSVAGWDSLATATLDDLERLQSFNAYLDYLEQRRELARQG